MIFGGVKHVSDKGCVKYPCYCVHLKLCCKSSGICYSDEVEFVGVALIVLAKVPTREAEQKPKTGFHRQKLMEQFVRWPPRLKGFIYRQWQKN